MTTAVIINTERCGQRRQSELEVVVSVFLEEGVTLQVQDATQNLKKNNDLVVKEECQFANHPVFDAIYKNCFVSIVHKSSSGASRISRMLIDQRERNLKKRNKGHVQKEEK